MFFNRRNDRRIFMELFYNDFTGDRFARGLITELSSHGMRVRRLLRSGMRSSRVVQIEFTLPGTGESIWAKGEACFDELEMATFGPAGDEGPTPLAIHSSGIHLVAMAEKHARLLRDFVVERRRFDLGRLAPAI